MTIMMYGSWDIKRDWHNFLSFSTIFSPFTPLKRLEISFYTSAPKIMIICYTVSEIWCVTGVIIFHFGLFFAILTPLTAWEIKILKKWKKHLQISWFYICVTKIIIKWCTVAKIWRMTDRQTKKVTYWGGCPT